MVLITAGQDGKNSLNYKKFNISLDHLKAWTITNDGKFEVVASGLATDPIYSMVCAGDR